MKTTRKTILAIALVLAIGMLPLLAQNIGSDGKDSASLETLRLVLASFPRFLHPSLFFITLI